MIKRRLLCNSDTYQPAETMRTPLSLRDAMAVQLYTCVCVYVCGVSVCVCVCLCVCG
jgi:hypothetical protein